MVLVAGLSLAVIVLTGAAVRLTEAGLGCENWPSCSDERFVPEWEFHPWIEFGNRLISGAVALAVAAAVLTAYRRQPKRRDLISWAWGLVFGVAAQIVLGGITVRVDLHPAFVGMHFLLSMVLLWNAIVLWVKAGSGPGDSEPIEAHTPPSSIVGRVPGSLLTHGRILVGLATVVLLTGIVVTGTGPNSGDSRADRFGFDLESVARIHSVAVWCFLLVAVVLAVRLNLSTGTGHPVERPEVDALDPAFGAVRLLIGVGVGQGAIGYAQFATGVPPALVALHIVGAIAVWGLSVVVHLLLCRRPPLEDWSMTSWFPSTADPHPQLDEVVQ